MCSGGADPRSRSGSHYGHGYGLERPVQATDALPGGHRHLGLDRLQCPLWFGPLQSHWWCLHVASCYWSPDYLVYWICKKKMNEYVYCYAGTAIPLNRAGE